MIEGNEAECCRYLGGDSMLNVLICDDDKAMVEASMTYLVNPLDGNDASPNGTCTYIVPCGLMNPDPCFSGFCIHCPQNAVNCQYPTVSGNSPTSFPDSES